MEKTFDISFNNLIFDNQFDDLPDYDGVYLFRMSKKAGDGLTSQVLYVGKANGENGLKGRVNKNHEHLPDARQIIYKANKSIANDNEKYFLTICYSDKTSYSKTDIERIEDALIFGFEPKINDKCTKSFNHDKTTINVGGNKKQDLKSKYVITRTE